MLFEQNADFKGLKTLIFSNFKDKPDALRGFHNLPTENKFLVVFLLMTISLFSGSSVFGQEHSYGKEEPVIHEMPTDSHGSEVEQTRIHQTDSIATFRPVLPKTKARAQDARHSEDEDALKFNFLYFIIQKFKFSDIID